MAKVRIPLPTNPKQQLELGATIYAKHQTDGSSSPLAGLNAQWAALGPQLASALNAHERAEQLRRQMEAAYEERDKAAEEAFRLIQRSRDILEGHYGPDSVRKLGDHGFTVDDSRRTPTDT